ncbi:uncharacterized protein LOC135694689 [Rhopilema esculentum]|uniref:uncharacterized protein LOC135694689 n=1 Tax=Rhopilema esculentum TaxID=499914 RepID=UPI0031CE212D
MSSSSSSDASITESNNATLNESSDEEGFAKVYGAVFMPYQYEPLASDNSDESEGADDEGTDQAQDEDSIRPSQLRDRFERNVALNEWCACNKCSVGRLVSAREYRCCREVHAAYGKVVFDGLSDSLSCITEHKDFKALVNKEVLKIVGPLLKQKNGKPYKKHAGVSENKYLRAVAYRNLVRWIFGYLGWDTARPLTACIYNFIREKYNTNNSKTGYKDSAQRE